MPGSTQFIPTTTTDTRSSTIHYSNSIINNNPEILSTGRGRGKRRISTMNGAAAMNPGVGGGPVSAIPVTMNNVLPNPDVKQGAPRMILGQQVIGARPGQPVGYNPAGIGKDDVLYWFRNTSTANRIDTLCTLFDSCVPFEIRLLGSVLEILGKKELNTLRESTNTANNSVVVKGSTLEANRINFFKNIKGNDDPGSSARPYNSNTPPSISSASSSSLSSTSTVPNNSQMHLNSNHSAKSVAASNLRQPLSTTTAAQETTNRPAPAHKTEQLRTLPVYEPPQLRQQVMTRNHSPAVANIPPPQPVFVNGTTSAVRSTSNCSSEDETDATASGSKDLRVLEYDSTRGKLIIYLALLKSTNHAAANVYYSLISQVHKTVGNPEWIERQSEGVMEEVVLIYTLAIHHPAFAYEQRLMLSEILMRARRELQKKKLRSQAAFAQQQQVFSPVQVYDPQYGQYYYSLSSMPPPPQQSHLHPVPSHEQHLGTPPPQQQHPPLSGSAIHPGMPLAPQTHMNFYQPLAFPLYQTIGSSTHPPNPAYINTAPIMSNAGQCPTIRSTSPNNIPPPSLGKDGAVLPSATKVETIIPPTPLYDKIPPPPLDPSQTPPSSQSQIVRSAKMCCYNCGQQGHLGPDCEESSLEQITHHLFRLNYEDNNNKNTSN